MPKRTIYTDITPLPPQVNRDTAIANLHDHDLVIKSNQSVITYRSIKPPTDAPKDELVNCSWYEITDKLWYLPDSPGGGRFHYRSCLRNISAGLEVHVYGPLGLDVRQRWSVEGFPPGGLHATSGAVRSSSRPEFYLREECDICCKSILSKVVMKHMKSTHKILAERIVRESPAHKSTSNVDLSRRGTHMLSPSVHSTTKHMSLPMTLSTAEHWQLTQNPIYRSRSHGTSTAIVRDDLSRSFNGIEGHSLLGSFANSSHHDHRLLSPVHSQYEYRSSRRLNLVVELQGSDPGEYSVLDSRQTTRDLCSLSTASTLRASSSSHDNDADGGNHVSYLTSSAKQPREQVFQIKRKPLPSM